MANDVLFDVDASKILAKLHLAGLAASGGYDKNTAFIVNTGIVDYTSSATLDNPGKTRFELKNSSSTYEVGIVMEIEYKKAYETKDEDGENMFNAYQKDFNELVAAKEALKKLDDKTNKAPIGSKPPSKDELNKKIADIDEKLKKQKADIAKRYKIDASKLDSPEGIEEMKASALGKDAKEAKANDKDSYEVKKIKAMGIAKAALTSYMTTFAGRDAFKGIGDDQLGMIVVSSNVKDASDKNLVKMFEIQPISDAEHEKNLAQFRANYEKNQDKPNCKEKICFKVKYELNVDK